MLDLLTLQELLPQDVSPSYYEQSAKLDIYYSKIEKAFTSSFMDDFWSEVTHLSSIEADESFVHGLRLGAQITLALLLPR